VDVNHPHAQIRSCRNGVRGGVGNIMEFEIEENVKTALLQVANYLRPEQGKHLFADFQTAVARVDAINKSQGVITIVVIESNNNRRYRSRA
jgi:hypothetical protein